MEELVLEPTPGPSTNQTHLSCLPLPPQTCTLLHSLQGEIGGSNSVLSAMLSEVSPSTGDYVRIGNIYGQVMNLMIAGNDEGGWCKRGWLLLLVRV